MGTAFFKGVMISFRALSKSFGKVTAVKDLSLDVESGEVVALLGPNGSGKTTSIRAAAGLIHPTSGQVLIGNPPRDASDPAAREACAFLPQAVAFPESLTGREVIEFYSALRRRSADRVREVMTLTGLNGASHRTVGTYSGGMLQRLGLAVAMLPEAPVLLLDEPTASLDPDGLCVFYGLIEARRRLGHTVLFSSHQMGDVERLADRFAVLVAGRLVATLTSSELSRRLADRGVMKISLGSPSAKILDAVRRIAPRAVWAADQLIVPGPAASRVAVLDIVRGFGATILGLTAEDGRLETLYRELVEGQA